ncbi:MAG: ATP-binding protein [Sulfurovum sp.]|nr:ATP-binding protein [Sulfurovum sp.]
MKLLKNKTILQLLMIIMVGICAFILYTTYTEYQKYDAAQNNTQTSSFLSKLESVLHRLEEERINNSRYLASTIEINLDKLKESRASVDVTLDQLDTFFKHNSVYESYSKEINTIRTELVRARKEVENKSDRTIVFKDQYSMIIESLLKILNAIELIQQYEPIKNNLSMYGKYTRLKENSVLENTGIYFVLLKSKAMSEANIVFWNKLITKDVLPRIDFFINTKLGAEIEALLSSEAFDAILSVERKMILYEAKRNNYSVSPVGWINQINKKIDYFTKVQSMLRLDIQKMEQSFLSEQKKIILWYAIASFVLLLLFFRLLGSYMSVSRDSKISKDTLKDIAMVFNVSQQLEIQRLIREGKVNHIYKFLIKAILDANQTKDLFLASMSHEIRTPLNGILGFTQLLKESDATEEQAEYISIIEKSSGNLLTIVNDILDLSKIKAQKIELENIEFDPIDTFETAAESYSAKAAESQIDFNLFLDPNLPTLLVGDPTKISQIIINLVSNAMKFTAKNGEVNVNVEKLSETNDEVQVKFEVADTGIGITKEQKSKIFEAFSQADVSTSREYGGTGLGLSISGKFVEFMGGKLSIWSVKDEGTNFYFTLTLKKPKSATPRKVVDMSGYRVGILNSNIDGEYVINKNLETYIAYTGAKIEYYTDESILRLKGSSKLPDVLFIDHSFRLRGNEIEQFLDFDTKIIVMATVDQKKKSKTL